MNAPFPLPEALYTLAADSPGAVLLETSNIDADNRTSYLFLNPARILLANKPDEIEELFRGIDEAQTEGFFVAGFVSYEAGYVLQGLPFSSDEHVTKPLAWFGVFTEPICFDHLSGKFTGAVLPPLPPNPMPPPHGFSSEEISLTITLEGFRKKVGQIKTHIAAGATYQINFTDRIHLRTEAQPAQLYFDLVHRQPVAYGALLNTGTLQILSMSPELFFRVHKRHITTRPMKGTWQRGRDLQEDTVAAFELQNDEKNRSEHLMIVDLLRNDLGRICIAGSVHVEDLFTVERYLTLLQMTSTVSGTLTTRLRWIDIFRSLFPSGSITGAPKLSSMGIIRSLEDSPREIYTGSIGYIAPNGNAAFNVAIRTLVYQDGCITMGVGSGIVIDSDANIEYAECLLKAAFLHSSQMHKLIETMRWETNFANLDLHMGRLRHSSDYFGFPFSLEHILNKLKRLATTFTPLTRHRVRLTLSRNGQIELTSKPLISHPDTCHVKISAERTHSTDIFLRHKTTHRAFYEMELLRAKSEGFDEVFFLNERDELTEGAISNVFVLIQGKLYTPPVSCGLLPGVFRRHLLDTVTTAQERLLTLQDLYCADAVYLCSSLRGLRKVANIDFGTYTPGAAKHAANTSDAMPTIEQSIQC